MVKKIAGLYTAGYIQPFIRKPYFNLPCIRFFQECKARERPIIP